MYLSRLFFAGAFLFCSMLLFTGFVSASTYTYEEHTYASMLVSDDLEQIKLGSIHIYRDEYDNQKLLDIAAEVLWLKTSEDLGQETKMNSDPDKIAWLIRLINKSTHSRYRPLLEQILTKAKNKVIKSEIKDALDDLSEDKMEAYVPGDVSLNEVRSMLKAEIANDKIEPTISNILSFSKEEKLATVFGKLGLPDSIATGKGLGSDSKKTYIQADYQGLASILFRIGKKKTKKTKAPGPGIVYIKLSGPASDNISDKISDEFLDLMLNAGSSELLGIAEILADNQISHTAILDAIAERIALHILRDNAKGQSKAIVFLCKAIKGSESGRYHDVLRLLKSQSKNRKVKKAASSALKKLKKTDQPQYISSSTNPVNQ